MPTLNDLRIAVDQGGVAPDNVRLRYLPRFNRIYFHS